MRAIAEQRRRFGYRRIGVLLAREGLTMNKKKLYRLYTDERLTVRKRKRRKRAMGSRTPMPQAGAPNARWSLDFVSDTFGPSRRFRALCVVDDCARDCVGFIADTSISGARVVRELDAMIRVYGKPACIVSDNVLRRQAQLHHWQKVSRAHLLIGARCLSIAEGLPP